MSPNIPIVPDRRPRIVPEVVIVRRWAVGVLGIWRGEGLGKGLGQVRSFYKQPETKVILSQLGGFQVSRKGPKGETKGNLQGEIRARGMRHV
jgi:hypothetical protein